MLIIIMGVSGCGKTTVGKMLAEKLALPFLDGDDYHPKGNVEKMSNGVALTDEDRQPWLEQLSLVLSQHEKDAGCVLACSALKEKYRTLLQNDLKGEVCWVHLDGSKELLQARLEKRTHRYMPSSLLDSQLSTLEKPNYAISISISLSPEEIVGVVISKLKPSIQKMNSFGIIGLGVMGRSLAMNLLDKQVSLSVYNRQVAGVEEDIAVQFQKAHPAAAGFDDIELFVMSLERPRKIMLMVNAGEAVDQVIEQLIPLLDPDDIIMDGGNSLFFDTESRLNYLATKGIHFLGVGVSGGEEGALKGPSIMPGGSEKAYHTVGSYLQKIAAVDQSGKPCCVYIGHGGAGHFVKMVHNGIEYSEMQMIAEVWSLLKNMPEMNPEKIATVLETWSQQGLGSFLLDITIDILRKKEGQDFLLDKVLDAAEQKGTGGWSVKAAMDLGAPLSTSAEAVVARMVSAMKKQRVQANGLYQINPQKIISNELTIEQVKKAYRAARIINHTLGFNMMKEASKQYEWNLTLSEIARIWTNGCIIRSELMETMVNYLKETEELLLHPEMVKELQHSWTDFSTVVAVGMKKGMALPVLSSSLNFFLSFVTADSPASLIQAQRDYFGAHTYRRKDKSEKEYFHSNWKS